MNELITNALKHAFPADRAGVIRVWMRPEDGGFELGVADDGIAAGDWEEPAGMGARLVESLAAQLGAETVDRRAGHGLSVTIRVPEPALLHATG